MSVWCGEGVCDVCGMWVCVICVACRGCIVCGMWGCVICVICVIVYAQVTELEASVHCLTAENATMQLEISSTHKLLTEARKDASQYAESASETLSNYQRELAQHGRTMEGLLAVKEEVSC